MAGSHANALVFVHKGAMFTSTLHHKTRIHVHVYALHSTPQGLACFAASRRVYFLQPLVYSQHYEAEPQVHKYACAHACLAMANSYKDFG